MAQADFTVGADPMAAGRIAQLFQISGGVLSLALLAGTGVWGYSLLMRDVSDIPVVRALEGPMREQPSDPGGAQAAHQGLAVNSVAAQGGAEGLAERVVLAPRSEDLTDEDKPAAVATRRDQVIQSDLPAATTVAAEVEAAPTTPAPLDPAADDEAQRAAILALVDQIAEGAEPLTTATPAVTGGIAVSLRPRVRPAALNVVKIEQTAAQTRPVELDPAKLTPGTRLVQLGAYESPQIARQEWDRIQGQFSTYLEGKQRVIQRAETGGRAFYRLRAAGFSDLADARRLCSALIAGKADCIPVVVR